MAYCSAVHFSTKFTTYYLLYGKNAIKLRHNLPAIVKLKLARLLGKRRTLKTETRHETVREKLYLAYE